MGPRNQGKRGGKEGGTSRRLNSRGAGNLATRYKIESKGISNNNELIYWKEKYCIHFHSYSDRRKLLTGREKKKSRGKCDSSAILIASALAGDDTRRKGLKEREDRERSASIND